jgi:YteA family regulatory protein
MFNQQQLTGLRNRLINDREKWQELWRDLEETGMDQSLSESVEEFSTYDNHPADVGSETFERSKDLALQDNAKLQIARIDDALQRMDQGKYGECEICGQSIPWQRLEAVPETTLCVECAKDQERTGDLRSRPVEEEVLCPPWGRHRKPCDAGPGEDMVMFDGEDAWQQLARTTEHAEEAQAGSYYGGFDPPDPGGVEDVEAIPYFRGEDGQIYEDVIGLTDDEGVPGEIRVGDPPSKEKEKH